MASEVYKITNNVGVYEKTSTSSTKKTTLKKGAKVTITSKKTDKSGNTWLKCSKGWFLAYRKSNKKTFAKSLSGASASASVSTSSKKTSGANYTKLVNALSSNSNGGNRLNKTMQLFGLPYQFLPSVDYRIDDISSEIGRKYIENIILDAPVVTIMPGKPTYLPGTKDKQSVTTAFLQAASGNLGSLQQLSKKMSVDQLKFYDFKTAYVEYMRYVNVMCRTCAAFLEIEDNTVNYQINGETVDDFLDYDWKNYRWNGSNYSSTIGKVASAAAGGAEKAGESLLSTFSKVGSTVINLFTGEDSKDSNTYTTTTTKKSKKKKKKKVKNTKKKTTTKIGKGQLNLNDNSAELEKYEKETNSLESLLRNVHYVQFYCDPASDVSENIGNTTKESSLKSAFNSVGDSAKDIAFMMNSGGVDTTKLEELGENTIGELGNLLSSAVGSINQSAGSLASRLLSTGGNVIKGENVIMPDIYSNSNYTKDYSITIPLRAMYGNKYSIYMDVLVPLCHILALALPKATTANTFASPFLVKIFMPGKFNCNMGIVTSVAIEKNNDSRNVDGLCTEMSVTLSITDLYSDLTMTPSNNPLLFINNSSLVEYLAINCGLDLVDSQFSTKMSLIWNNVLSAAKDTSDNVISSITEELDDLVYKMTSISN